MVIPMHRRRFLHTVAGGTLALAGGIPDSRAAANLLPLERAFVGRRKFEDVVSKARKNGWAARPIGQRMAFLALELRGVPYVGYTLEIDDRIECPSANFNGLDCWTFFEIVLGLARMLEKPDANTPADLLAEIEWTRYRGGKCTGNYLERIHYLNEWYLDNAARGNVSDLTKSFGVAMPLRGRESREMTVLWKSYRYLRKNPELRPRMAELEKKIDQLPVSYIPKASVPGIEPKLLNGDIIGIVTREQGGVCSHVGLILRPNTDAKAHFMHASSNHKKVVVDGTISEYLNDFKSHLGILVARPLPTARSIHDLATYQANLSRLTRA